MRSLPTLPPPPKKKKLKTLERALDFRGHGGVIMVAQVVTYFPKLHYQSTSAILKVNW